MRFLFDNITERFNFRIVACSLRFSREICCTCVWNSVWASLFLFSKECFDEMLETAAEQLEGLTLGIPHPNLVISELFYLDWNFSQRLSLWNYYFKN